MHLQRQLRKLSLVNTISNLKKKTLISTSLQTICISLQQSATHSTNQPRCQISYAKCLQGTDRVLKVTILLVFSYDYGSATR